MHVGDCLLMAWTGQQDSKVEMMEWSAAWRIHQVKEAG